MSLRLADGVGGVCQPVKEDWQLSVDLIMSCVIYQFYLNSPNMYLCHNCALCVTAYCENLSSSINTEGGTVFLDLAPIECPEFCRTRSVSVSGWRSLHVTR